ncbi:hypothetical protein [Absidia glauca]|uniref:Pre-mRNA polyadenylation factor Fip1 domain-containing protein n=1 Tax=Absidia glauca TaxID=4829 RepID=A0A163K445_ABSGL|nr:hypothetical protein [Absidia glauca]
MTDRNKNDAMDKDDVDDFLYGSDASEENYGITSKPATKKNTDEDDEIYEQYNEPTATSNSTPKKDQDDPMDEDREDEDEDEEEDSDDDLDIILEPEENETTPATTAAAAAAATSDPSSSETAANPLVNIKLGGVEAGSSSDTGKATGGVNLEAVGEYNGQPITELDVDIFEDKPWRKPGADITDYFNYGFNEVTWRAYCAKQKTIRDKKTTAIPGGKPDADMPDFMVDVPDFMKMGMMMPMMEGGMPMGMMNPMMNPMMMGMPPPPPPSSSSMGGPPPMMQNRSSGGDHGRMNQNYGGSNNSRPSRR